MTDEELNKLSKKELIQQIRFLEEEAYDHALEDKEEYPD